MNGEDINKKASELAAKIMSLSAGTLLLNMRFLAKAVNRLPALSGGEGLACDGTKIVYDPHFVLRRYKQSERLPVHDHLHMLLHCIFRHWHTGADIGADRWDAACDIAAEALIMQLGKDFCANERMDEKAVVIKKLSAHIRPLTAEKIYSYFVKNDISEDEINRYCEIFRTDDHSGWHKSPEREYEPEEQLPTISLGHPDESGNDDDNGRDDGSTSEEHRNEERRDGSEEENTADVNNADDDDASVYEELFEAQRQAELEQTEKLWQEISKEIQSELENFEKNAGNESKYLTQALKDVNRDRCDYAAFLRKFAVSGEIMKPDTDSFDVNLYTYGLSLYGNVALVEPPEYKEVRRVRDFVIAIDTSGSVSGVQVQSFIRKTYSILKSEESFFSKVNIYIIQCDTEVRDASKITDTLEFEKYIAQMEIRGLGGTDFRPVFEYVDELIKRQEFTSLKGLIYFTDGYGEYPDHKPPYDTAFAFLRSDYEGDTPHEAPPWAIKLILEEEDILYGR